MTEIENKILLQVATDIASLKTDIEYIKKTLDDTYQKGVIDGKFTVANNRSGDIENRLAALERATRIDLAKVALIVQSVYAIIYIATFLFKK